MVAILFDSFFFRFFEMRKRGNDKCCCCLAKVIVVQIEIHQFARASSILDKSKKNVNLKIGRNFIAFLSNSPNLTSKPYNPTFVCILCAHLFYCRVCLTSICCRVVFYLFIHHQTSIRFCFFCLRLRVLRFPTYFA